LSKGRVLIIAGSDSGGGAGVQADIKTVTMLGGYAMSAITAITAQNTLGVFGVHAIPPAMVHEQIRVVMEDIGADAIKIGMLGDALTVATVARALDDYARDVPIVLDPVMIAKGGARLLSEGAVAALHKELFARARLITPNAPEAEVLSGLAITDLESQKRAAEALVRLGARAALVKGGHIEGALVRDVLIDDGETVVFESARIDTRATHGTGCTLASAIATGLACGQPLREAVAAARDYVVQAILAAPGLGAGHGPLGHGLSGHGWGPKSRG